MEDKDVAVFVESKKSWINKVLLSNETKIKTNKSIIEYREIYVSGKKLPLVIADSNEILPDAVKVKGIKEIKKVLVSHFSESFFKFVNSISVETGIQSAGFTFKSYKSRWGCCDRNGKITFNSLLLMLPNDLQRYVVIHELCHTVHFNHSPEFWRLVQKFLPDYKLLRKQLRSYDYITKLY